MSGNFATENLVFSTSAASLCNRLPTPFTLSGPLIILRSSLIFNSSVQPEAAFVETKCRMAVDTVVLAAAEATRMGTTTAPAGTLADTQDLETTLHPTPMGMATLGLEHEVHGFLYSSVQPGLQFCASISLSFIHSSQGTSY